MYCYEFLNGTDFYVKHINDKDETVFERLKYLYPSEMYRENYFVCFDGDKVVGNLAIELNPYDENEYWMKHVSVDPMHQNKGISKELIRLMFEFLKQSGKKVSISIYSEEGLLYVKHVIEKYK